MSRVDRSALSAPAGSTAREHPDSSQHDAKAERVFQAVVYAYEGRAGSIPEDLRTHGMVQRGLKHHAANPRLMADAAEMLWVVVANVSEGDWTKQSADWQEAAARWRDNYFAAMKAGVVSLPDAVDPVGERGQEGATRAKSFSSISLQPSILPPGEAPPPETKAEEA